MPDLAAGERLVIQDADDTDGGQEESEGLFVVVSLVDTDFEGSETGVTDQDIEGARRFPF